MVIYHAQVPYRVASLTLRSSHRELIFGSAEDYFNISFFFIIFFLAAGAIFWHIAFLSAFLKSEEMFFFNKLAGRTFPEENNVTKGIEPPRVIWKV